MPKLDDCDFHNRPTLALNGKAGKLWMISSPDAALQLKCKAMETKTRSE